MIRPPFRADHVGSLLRPDSLKAARLKAARGEFTREQLKESEDIAIRHAIALQESAGLLSVTDGEFRRTMWHTDFLTGFEGIVLAQSNYAVKFHGKAGETAETKSMLVVTGKVRRSRPVMVDHFQFLARETRRTAKFCIPSANYLHMRGGRKIVDRKSYPDMEEFWSDIALAYQQEIADLAAAGCTYLQIDDVSFANLCDETIRAQITSDGEDPASLPGLYVKMFNEIVAKRQTGMAVTLHTCRGNHQSMWMASGGYGAIAETLFTGAEVDGFFLEFDTERAGGFEPLRFVPKGKRVVLGLVSSKEATLETGDELKRRIDEAGRYVPMDQLCLSPQCGFASTEAGNRVTEDIEKRKLELIVKVAEEVWGTSG
jgi:5-methyltetrahydropteroyltriglutamate--homocysteine methyltransferase